MSRYLLTFLTFYIIIELNIKRGCGENVEVCLVTFGFILFDIITGLLKAIKNNKLNSTKLREGLIHKVSEMICIVGAYALPFGLQYLEVDFKLPVLGVVAVYICLMEAISAIENLCEVNPIINKFFAPYLDKLKGTAESITKEGEKKDKSTKGK